MLRRVWRRIGNRPAREPMCDCAADLQLAASDEAGAIGGCTHVPKCDALQRPSGQRIHAMPNAAYKPGQYPATSEREACHRLSRQPSCLLGEASHLSRGRPRLPLSFCHSNAVGLASAPTSFCLCQIHRVLRPQRGLLSGPLLAGRRLPLRASALELQCCFRPPFRPCCGKTTILSGSRIIGKGYDRAQWLGLL